MKNRCTGEYHVKHGSVNGPAWLGMGRLVLSSRTKVLFSSVGSETCE